jgi:hypothetical protein
VLQLIDSLISMWMHDDSVYLLFFLLFCKKWGSSLNPCRGKERKCSAKVMA